MGLITNYKYNSNVCGHYFGGETNPNNWINPSTMRALFYYNSDIKKDSFPTGTAPNSSLILGDKGANLSSSTYISGNSTVTLNLSQGINISGNLAGTGTITSNLSLIVQLAATLLGTSTVTANLVGIVQMASNLIGSGNITAGLGLIANLVSTLNGTGSITANLKGISSLEANIYVNQSEATVQQIVTAVWEALAVEYNNPGTMGELLNSAGAGGNPWIANIEGTYTAGDIMKILASVLAGKTDITGNVATFRDINDTTDRVVATMTNSERTNITIDVT